MRPSAGQQRSMRRTNARSDAAVQPVAAMCEAVPADLPVVSRYGNRQLRLARGGAHRRRFETASDRQAAYRRRLAGLPEDLPRQNNRHGRRSLSTVVTESCREVAAP